MKRATIISVWLAVGLVYFGVSKTTKAIVYEEWDAIYTSHYSSSQDEAKDIFVDGLGNAYVTGSVWGGSFGQAGTGRDWGTIKYNSGGVVQWTAIYYCSEYAEDYANSITVDDSGYVYVTGRSFYGGSENDYVTVKYDANGRELWVAIWDGGTCDRALYIALDQLGNVYVTGDGYGPISTDLVTIKYNSDGEQIWLSRFDGPDQRSDYPYDMVLDSQCNIYIAGASYNNDDYDYLTLKYDSSGSILWEAYYNGPYNDGDYAKAIFIDENNNVYVTGCSPSEQWGYNYDIVTIKYNTDGQEMWIASWDGSHAIYNNDFGYDISVDNQGNVYTTGACNYSGVAVAVETEIVTIKYDGNGIEEWVAFYNGPRIGSSVSKALVLDDLGNVYVTGYCHGPYSSLDSDKDYVTIKYDTEGVLQWVVTYNGIQDARDEANSIGLDGDFNVYVTGKADQTGDINYDYGTIKYVQAEGTVFLSLTPTATPILFPASGGSFDFTLYIENWVYDSLMIDFWNQGILPNETTIETHISPHATVLPEGSSIYECTQYVPDWVEPGEWIYLIYAGIFPNIVWSIDTLVFKKDFSGEGETVDNWELKINSGKDNSVISQYNPRKHQIYAPRPNPFNAMTVIGFELPVAGWVKLGVFDIQGRNVGMSGSGTTPTTEYFSSGYHEVTFDGSGLASGIYIYRLEAGEFVGTGKMVLLK